MSEEERKLRLGYRKVRKQRLTVLTVLLSLVILATLVSSILATVLDKAYYVNYSENSSVNYGVHLKDNDFYEDSYIGKDYAYVASLIDKVEASFRYEILMNSATDVDFEYTYRVESVVQIRDKSNSKILYAPVYNESESVTKAVSGRNMVIAHKVLVDYGKYNDVANRFVNAYDLSYTDATLLLRLVVDVNGQSDAFHNNENKSSYVASVSVPLRSDTVEIKITSDAPISEGQILSYSTEDIAKVFRSSAIICAIVTALFATTLWGYAYLSRNVDVTYDIKVAKLIRSYKSFIQKMQNAFNVNGYQLILISEFEEMLEIHDTIQSPILMHENGDRTCTKFFIPTNTKLLYVYEIKVDDYDEIYGNEDELDALDTPAETVAVTAPAKESVIPESIAPVSVTPSPEVKPEPAPAVVTTVSDTVAIPEVKVKVVHQTVETPKIAENPAPIPTVTAKVIKATGAPEIIHTAKATVEKTEELKNTEDEGKDLYTHLPLFKVKTQQNTIHLRCELDEKEPENTKLNYNYKHKHTF